jgi:FPC/CPF motif-containing protein YcgG
LFNIDIALENDIFLANMSKSQHLAMKDLEMWKQYIIRQQDPSKCTQAIVNPQHEQPNQEESLDP